MKKFTLLKTVAMAVVLLVGSMNTWAQVKTYKLINSVTELEAGAKYLIIGQKSSVAYALGLQNTNNRASLTVIIASDLISVEPATVSTDTKPFEITLGGTAGTWTLYDGVNNGYLYAASTTSNYLRNQTTATNWTITFSGNAAVMTSSASASRNILRFNDTNNPPLFSCYSSGQTDVYLYKLQGSSTPPAAAPTFSPTPGTYYSAQSVSLASTTTDAKIYYTTDGTAPTSASTLYTAPIAVAATTTIKAIAYDATNANPSTVVSGEYIIATPTITVTETTIPAMTAAVGETTDTRTITVGGNNLTNDISLAITGTDAAQFSVSPATIAKGTGTVTDQTVTITYTPTTGGTHTATLEITSTDAVSVTRTLTGTATAPTLDAPVATDETGVSQTGFTANWNAVAGATEYQLDVYTKTLANAPDLYISEYGEGSGNNKYIEIFNGTGSTVDLSSYSLKQSYNGAGWPVETTSAYYLALSGTLANNDVYVISSVDANATILAQADLKITYSTSAAGGKSIYFTGNDALGLFKNDVLIDVFGDPSSNSTIPVAGFSTYGLDHTIVRKSTINKGNTDWVASSGTNKTDSEWIGYPQDTWTYVGAHTVNTTLAPITGSPFTGITTNSFELTGLNNANTYYYTVTAKNATLTSIPSNEIEVALTLTGLKTVTDARAWTANGKVLFTAAAGELVEIYNATGQKLVSSTAVDGLNQINLTARGVLVVKVANRIAKVVL